MQGERKFFLDKVANFITNKYCQNENKEIVKDLDKFLSENKEYELYILNRLAKARLNETNCGNYDILKNVLNTNNILEFITQLILENYDYGNDDLIKYLTGDLTDDDKYKVIINAIELFNDYDFNRLINTNEKVFIKTSESILRLLKLIYNKLSFAGTIDEILTHLISTYNVKEMDDFYKELQTLPTITKDELSEVDTQINELIYLKMDEED